MAKYTPTLLSTTLSNSAASTINENLTNLSEAIENTLSRDGSTPNQMTSDIDLNNNDLLNVGTVDTENLILNGKFVTLSDLSDIPPGVLDRENHTGPVLWPVETRTSLKSLDTTKFNLAYLKESDREGIFKWTLGNFSSQIGTDTLEGLYIKADDVLATVGAWVRVYDGKAFARWFGSGQAAIQAAHLLVDDLIIDRTFAVTSSVTWPNGKTYEFISSGKLTVANAITLTIRGIVKAPRWRGLVVYSPNKIFDTTGTGKVIGVRSVHEQWFGAIGNGTADDRLALQNAHDCVEGSFASDGGRPEVDLAGMLNFGLGSTLFLRPTANINLKFTGAGPVFGGTRFTALTSFSTSLGNMAIRIDGSSDSIQQIAAFDIGNFTLLGAVGTPALVGYQIGGDGTTTNLIGLHQQSSLHDIHSNGFQICAVFQQVRLVDVRRCSYETTLNAAVACRVISNTVNGFTGDLDFNSCQFIGPFGGGTPTGACVELTSAGSGLCNVSGIGFNDSIFYGSQFQLTMSCSANSFISDIWVNPRCQFEAPPRGAVLTRGINISATGSNAVIYDVQIRGTYMSGNGHHKAISVAASSSGQIRNLQINNNFLANSAAETVDIRGTGGTVRGVHGLGNNVHGSGTASQTFYFENVTQFNLQNNLAEGTAGDTNFITIGTGCNFFVVTGNNRGGLGTTSVNDTTGAVTKVVANNI